MESTKDSPGVTEWPGAHGRPQGVAVRGTGPGREKGVLQASIGTAKQWLGPQRARDRVGGRCLGPLGFRSEHRVLLRVLPEKDRDKGRERAEKQR